MKPKRWRPLGDTGASRGLITTGELMVVKSPVRSMTPESFALTLIALGILGAHAATLRLLSACKSEITEHMTANILRSEASRQHLEEVVRIGADVADSLDGIIAGIPVDGGGATPVLAAPPSLQDTIIGLMVDRFLSPKHGGTTEQIGAIYQEQATTQDDFIQQSTTQEPTQAGSISPESR